MTAATTYPPNLAGRLLAILQRAMVHAGTVTIRSVWAAVFGTKPDDVTSIQRKLVQLDRLVTRTEELIKADTSANPNLLLRHTPRIRAVLAVDNFDAPWDRPKKMLDGAPIADLEHCADQITRHYPEAEVEKDDLDQISTGATNLFNQFKAADDVDRLVQQSILQMLQGIRDAVAEYEIRGAEGLEDALSIAIGRLIVQRDLVRKATKRPLLKDYFALLAKVDTVVSKVMRYRSLLETTTPPALDFLHTILS